jgi:cytochrome c peroxidase
MTMRKLTIATNVIALAWITIACQPVDQVQKPGNDGLQLPDVPYVYDHTIQPNDNIPTLGRVLFYDPRLSANSAISCSSCHKQNLAFADNLAFSLGFGQQKTKRNALTIQNEIDPVHPMDSILLFWDGRESLLPVMVLDPIVNSAEMGNTDINTVVSKLANLPEYQDLFQKAYGNPSVNSQLIAQALTAFIDNFQSRTSAFDLSKSQV